MNYVVCQFVFFFRKLCIFILLFRLELTQEDKPHMTYWQSGLNIRYLGGSIIVQRAKFIPSSSSHSSNTVQNSISTQASHVAINAQSCHGILITILSDSATLADLAVVGYVTDELNSALHDVFHCESNYDVCIYENFCFVLITIIYYNFF